MPTGRVLSVYLAADLKERWIDHCKQQGETASAGVHQVIVHLLSRELPVTAIASSLQGRADRSRRRLELRLTESELTKVYELAIAQGMSTNQWVVGLVRAHLTAQPQFGMTELLKLGESNKRLLSLGRNLNQVARHLNAGSSEMESPEVEQIRALSSFIKEHAEHVAEVIRANIDRWTLM